MGATNNPNAWRTRGKIGRRSSNTVMASFATNGAANTWYYVRPRYFEQFNELSVFAGVDGAVGTLANLSLRIQVSDGMAGAVRLVHHSFIDVPAADTGQQVNPYTVASPVAGAPQQQQTVTITGSPTGGTFTLTFNGQTTGALAYNVPANGGVGATASVQNALQALSTIGTAFNNNARAQVIGNAGGPYTVQFFDTLLFSDIPLMTASGAGLTGGSSPAVAVAAAPSGVLAINTCGRVGDWMRAAVKWGTASGNSTKIYLIMKAKG